MKQKIFQCVPVQLSKKNIVKSLFLFLFTLTAFVALASPSLAKQEAREDEGFSTNEFGNNPPNDYGPQIYTNERGDNIMNVSPPPPPPSQSNNYSIDVNPDIYVNPERFSRDYNPQYYPHPGPNIYRPGASPYKHK